MSELLPTIQLETAPHPDAAVIVLHGLGADGNDFVPIVRELDLPEESRIRFIFPHAPVRPVSINNGFQMRAWYDIVMSDLTRRPDLQGVRESQAQVEALIAHEKSRGINASRIVLAGFSQGGVICLQTGLRYGERLAGIIALSTYLVSGETLPAEASAENRNIPIFMAHGTQDPMIDFRSAEASRSALQSLGYNVEWHTYPMPHSVSLEEIRDIARFLRKVLPLIPPTPGSA